MRAYFGELWFTDSEK